MTAREIMERHRQNPRSVCGEVHVVSNNQKAADFQKTLATLSIIVGTIRRYSGKTMTPTTQTCGLEMCAEAIVSAAGRSILVGGAALVAKK